MSAAIHLKKEVPVVTIHKAPIVRKRTPKITQSSIPVLQPDLNLKDALVKEKVIAPEV